MVPCLDQRLAKNRLATQCLYINNVFLKLSPIPLCMYCLRLAHATTAILIGFDRDQMARKPKIFTI